LGLKCVCNNTERNEAYQVFILVCVMVRDCGFFMQQISDQTGMCSMHSKPQSSLVSIFKSH